MRRELHRVMFARPLAWLASLALLSGCGSKTDLLVPDIGGFDATDTVALDREDVPLVCRDGVFSLEPRAADIVLVVDRSGSVSQPLGAGGVSKWTALRNALANTLPRYTAQLGIGAFFYPAAGPTMQMPFCTLTAGTGIDVEPATGTSTRVIEIFGSTNPGGSTPTAGALQRAYDWFASHSNRAHSQFLVLATDGGPNCNAALDPRTCTCAGNRMGGVCGRNATDGSMCLDDTRTVDVITRLANDPAIRIPTFVIGLAAQGDPIFAATLTSMAIAGGRPNLSSGMPSFYDVREASDLESAFDAIVSSIARCTFVTPSVPADPSAITIALDGADIAHDTTHRDGWDWTESTGGEITLFGSACTTATATMSAPVATVHCPDDGG